MRYKIAVIVKAARILGHAADEANITDTLFAVDIIYTGLQ